jgi:tetratricopeptide (TPR) repeat protein
MRNRFNLLKNIFASLVLTISPVYAMSADNTLEYEILIAESESKAIDALKNLLTKKRGQPEEADLWFRLSELYMRKSKTGRFFEFIKDDKKVVKKIPPALKNESSRGALLEAVKIYFKIERDFPKYALMDEVIYNNAFANQLLHLNNVAISEYEKLLSQFPNSKVSSDAYIAVGDIYFDLGNFEKAEAYFKYFENKENLKQWAYGTYKGSWSLYNLKRTHLAIDKMKLLLTTENNRHDLRSEALRDLAIFYSDTQAPEKALSFFRPITQNEELEQSILAISKIYISHSKNKELLNLLSSYTESETDSKSLPMAHMLMAQTYENLKNRTQVIQEIEKANQICEDRNNPEICEKEIYPQTIEFTKKWWELWEKNKQSKEVAVWIQGAFKALIDHEKLEQLEIQKNHEAPESAFNSRLKVHFAYAEFLFQIESFDRAADQYQLVYTKSNQEALREKSLYAYIVSYEKIINLTKEAPLELKSKLKDNCLLYIKTFPKAAQNEELSVKAALIEYEQAHYENAQVLLESILEKYKDINSILKSEQKKDLKNRILQAQDILLDIYNLQKNYDSLLKLAKNINLQNWDEKRIKKCQEIINETEFIMALVNKSNEEKIQSLIKYKNESTKKLTQKNPDDAKSSLIFIKKALAQLIQIYLAEGLDLQAAASSREFALLDRNDAQSDLALSESEKIYARFGFYNKAADLLKERMDAKAKAPMTEKDRALALENLLLYYELEENSQGLKSLLTTLDPVKNTQYVKISEKLLKLYKKQNEELQYTELKKNLINLRIEPYFTESKVSALEDKFSKDNYTTIFNDSKKIINSEGPSKERARARLLQARVLEEELKSQSLKCRPDRLAMVIALKTEKLDKAQQAYINSLKISEDLSIQIGSLQGQVRIYSNFIESLNSLPEIIEASPAEKEQLKKELASMTLPLQDKKNEISHRLSLIATDSSAPSEDPLSLSSQSSKDFFQPVPFWKELKKYKEVVSKFKSSEELLKNFESKKSSLESTLENQALLALKLKQFEKSLFVSEFGLKTFNTNISLKKYKVLSLISLNEDIPLKKYLETEIELEDVLKDAWFKNLKMSLEFEKNNCAPFLTDLNLEAHMHILSAECLALNGNLEGAFKILANYDAKPLQSATPVKSVSNLNETLNLTAMLEKARIKEKYQDDVKASMESYETALKMTQEKSIKKQLEDKIQSLKNNLKSAS